MASMRVYPRVGGGTQAFRRVADDEDGLSPRGRGNRTFSLGCKACHGSIPAWAGEPQAITWCWTRLWVYPRVGGGTMKSSESRRPIWGLSPRGRGNHPSRRIAVFLRRSIPAWAGEPGLTQTQETVFEVYPRVGGEPTRTKGISARCRVYPRVGGGTQVGGRGNDHGFGLSPRGRGNPPLTRQTASLATVYPRVGGGTSDPDMERKLKEGLSPRGRGNLSAITSPESTRRSIPAWAGEPQRIRPERKPKTVYPRVGGGTAKMGSQCGRECGLSPRGRGNRLPSLRRWAHIWSIPAWAGEPLIGIGR